MIFKLVPVGSDLFEPVISVTAVDIIAETPVKRRRLDLTHDLSSPAVATRMDGGLDTRMDHSYTQSAGYETFYPWTMMHFLV